MAKCALFVGKHPSTGLGTHSYMLIASTSVVIDMDQMQRVVMTENKKIEQLAPRDRDVDRVPKTRRVIRYSKIDSDLFDEIELVESSGNYYGSKIQTLVRHLLYLQEKEPEAKSIIFSAWADSLHSEIDASFLLRAAKVDDQLQSCNMLCSTMEFPV